MHLFLTRAEVEDWLRPFSGRYLGNDMLGAERWTTYWGHIFWLTPEDDGTYHEYMVQQAIDLSIKPSMP